MAKHKASEAVINEMLAKIESKEWAPRIKLPTEQELSESFHVSRNTLREAVQTLVDRGYLKRMHGCGTIVLPRTISYGMENFLSASELINRSGYIAAHIDVTLEIEKPSQKIADYLGIAEYDPVYKITRLHTVSEKPGIFEVMYVPAHMLSGVTQKSFEGSMFKLLESRGMVPSYADSWVKAIRPTAEIAELLEQKQREPVLELDMIMYDTEDRVVGFVQDYFSDWFDFPIRRIRHNL
ncbi:MAG: GntR family transcriptional regulator [Christensenella sp.]